MQKMKRLVGKYKHAWILLYFIIYVVWFMYLENRTSVSYYPIHIGLDDMIPFCEYFIIPYLLWFAYVALTIIYFFFVNKKDYYKCCAFLFIGMTICLIIYTFFPNQQNLRPVTFERQNIFTDIVQIIYSTDTSTNVCPSIHVLNSLGVFISIIESEALRKKKVICVGSGVLSVLICLSTVFLKQHSVIDGLCALGLAIVLYAFIYKVNYTKLLLRMEEEEQKTRTKQQKEIG